jgi:uncharacterized protein (DUF1499 family)
VYLSQNTVETSEQPVFPELKTPAYDLPADTVYKHALDTVDKLQWQLKPQSPESHEIHAVVQTPVLGFRDDVWVRVETIGDSRCRVHVRSASRIGKADFGANLRHVLDFKTTLDFRIQNYAK